MSDEVDDAEISRLVVVFAESIIKQDRSTTAPEGNRHAEVCLAAFLQLTRRFGDRGREALASLFTHSWPRVRVVAAAFLLRYKHAEAMQLLEDMSKEPGMVGFGAERSIYNWNNGYWELDP
jgi:hypothetical protein